MSSQYKIFETTKYSYKILMLQIRKNFAKQNNVVRRLNDFSLYCFNKTNFQTNKHLSSKQNAWKTFCFHFTRFDAIAHISTNAANGNSTCPFRSSPVYRAAAVVN